MTLIDIVKNFPLFSQPPFAVAISFIVITGFLLIVISIIVDFRNYHRQNAEVVSTERSFVETGSMAIFFILYYLVIKFRLLEVYLNGDIRITTAIVGLILIIAGVVFNVYGRVALESNWANQIKIYEHQELIRNGPYSRVRHPLYASLIWIFIGGSLVYSNILSLLLTFCVFIPMMYFRAKSEDGMLKGHFNEEFLDYKNKAGMFLPKLWRRK